MTKHFVTRLGLWGALLGVSFLMNGRIYQWIVTWQNPLMTELLANLCSYIFFIILVAMAVESLVWHEKKEYILPCILGFLVAYRLGMVMKNIFEVPRPFITYGLTVFMPEAGFSFPSAHAIAVFSLLPLVWFKNKRMGIAWLSFCLLIAFSRIYLQVHYFSDVVMGAFLGCEIAYLFLWMEDQYHFFKKFNTLFVTTLEIRRQILHTLSGGFLVFCIYIYVLTFESLVLIVSLLGVTILLLKRYQFPSFLYRALAFFEREKHLQRFPARGLFYFLLAAVFVLGIFPERIALTSLLILAFGDSVTNIVGRYFGKWTIFYAPKKHWEGTLAGIVLSTLVANSFVPLLPAFVASVVSMFVETFNLKIGVLEIDDNITIPLVAGGVLLLML